ncbi:MAG: alanine dehydrogenase [Candidatus Polarisedimenticolaceae bacterium]|nr:alanine dehydrogenase [Candidatus Polarisedimenticolaceae bacterium]
MQIGVPKEIKDRENRVAVTPQGVEQLVAAGHAVKIERDAGLGAGFLDADYEVAGAQLVSVESAWQSELVIKVKEPLAQEYCYLDEQILFTFLHLAGVAPSLTEQLLKKRTTAIAYETVKNELGRLPLLAPMSAIAGNTAVIMGNYHLATPNGGRGTQLGQVFGHPHGKVLVVGDGVVGVHAAKAADGLGAQVTIVGIDAEKEVLLKQEISPHIHFLLSTPENLMREIADADLVIGAVLLPGAKAPDVISREMVKSMQPGTVIVDVSIDQGGCVETARPTSHTDPTYIEHGVIHYCVTNMPAAYPRTATMALTTATLPFVKTLAAEGVDALRNTPNFALGLNTYQGYITCQAVAESLAMMPKFRSFASLS